MISDYTHSKTLAALLCKPVVAYEWTRTLLSIRRKARSTFSGIWYRKKSPIFQKEEENAREDLKLRYWPVFRCKWRNIFGAGLVEKKNDDSNFGIKEKEREKETRAPPLFLVCCCCYCRHDAWLWTRRSFQRKRELEASWIKRSPPFVISRAVCVTHCTPSDFKWRQNDALDFSLSLSLNSPISSALSRFVKRKGQFPEGDVLLQLRTRLYVNSTKRQQDDETEFNYRFTRHSQWINWSCRALGSFVARRSRVSFFLYASFLFVCCLRRACVCVCPPLAIDELRPRLSVKRHERKRNEKQEQNRICSSSSTPPTVVLPTARWQLTPTTREFNNGRINNIRRIPATL